MTDYTAMTDRQLMDLSYNPAGPAMDEHAHGELMRRQNEGRAVRLYPGPRTSPSDDGIVPVQIQINDDHHVEIKVGRPMDYFAMPLERLGPWTESLIKHSTEAIADLMANHEVSTWITAKEILNDPVEPTDFSLELEPHQHATQPYVGLHITSNEQTRYRLTPSDVATWMQTVITFLSTEEIDPADIGTTNKHLSSLSYITENFLR